MTSLDFNFAEPIASYRNSADENMDASPADIGSIRKSDYVVLNGRPLKVVEITHSKPGKHGHSKVHLVGIDIFTGRRYEDVRPIGHMIMVPNVTKKDYLVVNIEEDRYMTLLNEDTCVTRNDIEISEDSDIGREILDRFNDGNGQIKVTVLKALGEEQIIACKMID
jgi:translation initiation factor 5A